MEIVDIMPYVLLYLKIFLYIFGITFLLNGLNEFFIDLVKMYKEGYRKYFVFKRKSKLTENDLLSLEEKKIAIMIPAWDESAVIDKMLDNSIRTLNYLNYVIFVGTYPNDEATQLKVYEVREKYPNIEIIVCPKDGPTSKADCLNWIYEGILLYEKNNDVKFELFVMEDSEDILHPYTLKLFNYLCDKADMIQLPVIPIPPDKWYHFTRGTYLDEFATNHSRDMYVREVLSKNIPSAGVGTAINRKIMNTLYNNNKHQLFSIGSVTEDYEFGIKMNDIEGIKQIFSKIYIEKSIIDGDEVKKVRDLIGIREYFPNVFKDAIKQKSRWIVGITMQGWKKIGWYGGFWMKYMLLRDRLAIFTNQFTMLANVLVPIYLSVWGYKFVFPEYYIFPSLVESGSILFYILLSNLVILLWQFSLRFYYVNSIHGKKQAFLSIPRLFWCNIINYFATIRALKLYMNHLLFNKPIAWDKTDHAYPTEEELVSYRRKIGEMLLDKKTITIKQLTDALEKQKTIYKDKKLGEILVLLGYSTNESINNVLNIKDEKL